MDIGYILTSALKWYILQGIKLTDLGRVDHNLKSDGDGDHVVPDSLHILVRQ